MRGGGVMRRCVRGYVVRGCMRGCVIKRGCVVKGKSGCVSRLGGKLGYI